MPLIVEDGTGKIDSNSFVSEAKFIDFCLERAVTIGEEAARVHLIKAMDFINVLDAAFQGHRTVTTQALPFPRSGVVVAKRAVGPNDIPRELVLAQQFLAVASFNGLELQPIVEANGKQLVEKTVGPIQKKWQFNTETGGAPVVPQASSYLALLLADSGVRYNQRG